MTDSFIRFFDNLPVNHWSSLLIAVLSILFLIYSIFFFFSREGKDERGKKIVSTASFTAFIVAILLLFIFNSVFYEVATHSNNAYAWSMNFLVFLIAATEAGMIAVLKKSS